MSFLEEINNLIIDFLNNIGIFATVVASLCISLEAIIPILPLGVFITINFFYFGPTLGFVISWLFTCLGCYLTFKLCQMKFRTWLEKKVMKKHENLFNKLLVMAQNIKVEQLMVLMAITFIPSIVINLVAGTLRIDEKKYLIALLVGKIFEVSFWGIVGTSFLDSFKNPGSLIVLSVIVIAAFIVTKLINKKYKIG